MFVVTRCAGGITLNAGIREVLRDGERPIIFTSKKVARAFIRETGMKVADYDLEEATHEEISSGISWTEVDLY